MKNIGTLLILFFISAATAVSVFSQNNMIAQLITYAGGVFAVLVALAVFVVRNWPEPAPKQLVVLTDNEIVATVQRIRSAGSSDAAIATVTGIDIDVIKAIP